MALSAKDIASLSSTYFGYNERLANNLSKQKTDTMIGFALLLGAVLFQMVNLAWPLRIVDFGVNKAGFVIAICVSVLVAILSLYVSKTLGMKTIKEVTDILKKGNQK